MEDFREFCKDLEDLCERHEINIQVGSSTLVLDKPEAHLKEGYITQSVTVTFDRYLPYTKDNLKNCGSFCDIY